MGARHDGASHYICREDPKPNLCVVSPISILNEISTQ